MNPEAIEFGLIELAQHQCGWVVAVSGQDDDAERLMAMGVCPGRMVELIQRGDPLILKVYGTRIGVAARLAERVSVRPCLASHCQTKPDAREDSSP